MTLKTIFMLNQIISLRNCKYAATNKVEFVLFTKGTTRIIFYKPLNQ